ncbi:uncharacterized protein LOC128672348 [Plodia interpunctella]|uniref:uncharacterized protein LOC128672348 n=1 Tax=Plodia interpunctella TaxID=58824 RepID=UPI0023680DC9|nr:uncharacterized protein LOC128672348 [Plodia interpunctella]
MESVKKLYICAVVLVVLLAVPLSAQVRPSRCPTNKIAPHRRVPNWQTRIRGRTFGGAFIDLLSHDGVRPQELPQNNLQEKPQEDDPDDCGDIEDYDENDLSLVTQKLHKRQGKQHQRFFFNLFNKPSDTLTTRTRPPTTSSLPPALPPLPSYSAVSPFWSGGLFGSNPYRPPRPENPSDSIKPVHEHEASESQTTYWPSLVGGPLGNIVGASPAIPTFTAAAITTPGTHTTGTNPLRYTRRPRPTYPNSGNTVVRSFVDLFI